MFMLDEIVKHIASTCHVFGFSFFNTGFLEFLIVEALVYLNIDNNIHCKKYKVAQSKNNGEKISDSEGIKKYNYKKKDDESTNDFAIAVGFLATFALFAWSQW